MDNLFRESISSNNKEYLVLRDEERHTELKNYCLTLWEKFAPFADRSFCKEFALHPHQRFWEMYLGVRLLNLGFELIPRTLGKGPDLHIIIDNRHVWIEATVPSEGIGVDSVPTIKEHSGFDPIPEEKIILRFTNSISEKREKFTQYIQDGLVSSDDSFLIGICGGRIQLVLRDAAPIPVIVKSVYPIGEHQIIIDTNKLEIVEERYQLRSEIIEDSGSPVSTRAFVDPAYSGISGILFSNTTMTYFPTEPNDEFLFVHNILADVPLGKGWLKTGKDCWIEGDKLNFA